MSLTPTQRQHILANCRLDTWQRQAQLLQSLHVPAGTSPQLVADWLEAARPTARAEAARALTALQRHRWGVEGLPSPGVAGLPAGAQAGAGLLLKAGPTTWWLRFASQPTLHVMAIERFVEGGAR